MIRCRNMALAASPAAARCPLQVKALLEEGLSLRDRYSENRSRCTGCGRLPDGWRRSWTAC